MYKKYHNMLQVVLAVSPSSGGLNRTDGLIKQEIKEFYLYEDLFVGDKLVSDDVKTNHNKMQAKK
jgi:hypothetical protein